jgi:hypothetical protein
MSGQRAAIPVAVYLGAGVGVCDDAGYPLLPRAVGETKRVALLARVFNEKGRPVATATLRPSSEEHRGRLGPLPAGAYRVLVGGVGAIATRVEPVTSAVVVWYPGVKA